jgi:hypothetical protein
MGKLSKIIDKSKVQIVKLKYDKEIISFNLAEELVVNESKLNSEIKNQPSYYGFLCILMAKLERLKNDQKAQMERVEAKIFIKYKNKNDPKTNRPYSNDLAEAKAKTDEGYQKAVKKYNKTLQDFSIIKSCVGSFEQRGSLIQSLSANVRNERNNS